MSEADEEPTSEQFRRAIERLHDEEKKDPEAAVARFNSAF